MVTGHGWKLRYHLSLSKTPKTLEVAISSPKKLLDSVQFSLDSIYFDPPTSLVLVFGRFSSCLGVPGKRTENQPKSNSIPTKKQPKTPTKKQQTNPWRPSSFGTHRTWHCWETPPRWIAWTRRQRRSQRAWRGRRAGRAEGANKNGKLKGFILGPGIFLIFIFFEFFCFFWFVSCFCWCFFWVPPPGARHHADFPPAALHGWHDCGAALGDAAEAAAHVADAAQPVSGGRPAGFGMGQKAKGCGRRWMGAEVLGCEAEVFFFFEKKLKGSLQGRFLENL